MEDINWLKQAADKPLFTDLLWSRPENKQRAGKLLIIGGNLHGFAAPVAAYSAALAAGIGTSRVILPEALKKTIGTSFEQAEFAPSTPSGSFARLALDTLIDATGSADAVLLAGDFGHNSETAILLSSFLEKYKGQATIAHDALDYFLSSSSPLLNRSNTLSVINMGKLQKLAKNNGSTQAIRHSMNLHELVTVLADWANSSPAAFLTKHAESYVAASGGRASTTPVKQHQNWQTELAAYASVWLIQQPQKTFEAITTAVYNYLNVK